MKGGNSIALEEALSQHTINVFQKVREAEKYLDGKNSRRYPWPLRDGFKVSPSKKQKRLANMCKQSASTPSIPSSSSLSSSSSLTSYLLPSPPSQSSSSSSSSCSSVPSSFSVSSTSCHTLTLSSFVSPVSLMQSSALCGNANQWSIGTVNSFSTSSNLTGVASRSNEHRDEVNYFNAENSGITSNSRVAKSCGSLSRNDAESREDLQIMCSEDESDALGTKRRARTIPLMNFHYEASDEDKWTFAVKHACKYTDFAKSDWIVFKDSGSIQIGQIDVAKRNGTFQVWIVDGKWPGPHDSLVKENDAWVWVTSNGRNKVSIENQTSIICGFKSAEYMLERRFARINSIVQSIVALSNT